MSEVTPDELAVWRTFHAMRRQLDHALEQQLQRDSGISQPDYEILIALLESPDARLRSREIGERIGWEKSRISHQVTRMEVRGLVERTECEDDLRGTWVGLTPAGERAIRQAVGQHRARIRELFFDVLSGEELAALRAMSERVLQAIDPPVCEQGGNSAG